jgi:hypothetical protein
VDGVAGETGAGVERGRVRTVCDDGAGLCAEWDAVSWGVGKVRKQFFFEKKNQKTFTHAASTPFKRANLAPPARDKSFLVLFFKKELLPSLLHLPSCCFSTPRDE